MITSNFFLFILIFTISITLNTAIFQIKNSHDINYLTNISIAFFTFIISSFLSSEANLGFLLLLIPFVYTIFQKTKSINNLHLLNLITFAFLNTHIQDLTTALLSCFIISILNFVIHSKILFPRTKHETILILDGLRWQNLNNDNNLQIELENMLSGSLLKFSILEINQIQETVTIQAKYAN